LLEFIIILTLSHINAKIRLLDVQQEHHNWRRSSTSSSNDGEFGWQANRERQGATQMDEQHPDAASPIGEAATGDGAKAHDQQSSVLLLVKSDDRTVLTALIDRTASQKKIIDEFRRALPRFAVPYRELEPQVLDAIRLRVTENITFEEASIRVFGTPNYARTIRYWRNRWGFQ
jgi:hypothetical protein